MFLKKRTGIYVRKDIKYTRKKDLESPDCHIVIIDVLANITLKIISLYRSFRPPGMISPDAFFKIQLGILKKALTSNCYIMGDFNLDATKLQQQHKMRVRNIVFNNCPFDITKYSTRYETSVYVLLNG